MQYIDEIFCGFDQNRRGITVERPTLDQLVQVKVDFEGARGAKIFFSFFHFISCQTPPSGHNMYYKCNRLYFHIENELKTTFF